VWPARGSQNITPDYLVHITVGHCHGEITGATIVARRIVPDFLCRTKETHLPT
jgi:hypothetical protein